jgi:pyruvate formate lyase activating enzyme
MPQPLPAFTGRPQRLPQSGEPGRHPLQPGLRQCLFGQRGPDREKAPVSFSARHRTFSIASRRVQLSLPQLPKLGDFPTRPEDVRHFDLFPEAVVSAAVKSGCQSIAYTYSEPTTFYEYMIDTARIAKSRGLNNVWISNGYINREPLLALCRVIDGANVNLKSISDDIYRRLNGGG